MDKEKQQKVYYQLAYYTLSHKDRHFIHQHIVDAFAAQMADENTKPIAIAFALAGLYLFLEKGFTGRQVQVMHMKMAKSRKSWPQFELPEKRGGITVKDVLSTPEGKERDEKIKEWCQSVWDAYGDVHAQVADLMEVFLA